MELFVSRSRHFSNTRHLLHTLIGPRLQTWILRWEIDPPQCKFNVWKCWKDGNWILEKTTTNFWLPFTVEIQFISWRLLAWIESNIRWNSLINSVSLNLFHILIYSVFSPKSESCLNWCHKNIPTIFLLQSEIDIYLFISLDGSLLVVMFGFRPHSDTSD